MNGIKGQKDMTLKDESPRAEGIQYATGEEWRRTNNNSPRKIKQLGQGGNNIQLWMCLGIKEKKPMLQKKKKQYCIGT